MKYLPLLILLLIGCGRTSVLQINPELKPYYQDFINNGIDRGVDLSEKRNLVLEFGDLKKNQLGRCSVGLSKFSFVTPEVIIDKKSWDNSTELDRQTVVHHELAHCLMLKPHDDSTNSEGYPDSIMNTYSVSDMYPEYLAEHWDEYLDKLFK